MEDYKDSIWGHRWIDINGNSYPEKIDSFEWMIHHYYQKTHGHAKQKFGEKTRICLKINPLKTFSEANESLNNYMGSMHDFDERTAKRVFSKLENMIRRGIRDSETRGF